MPGRLPEQSPSEAADRIAAARALSALVIALVAGAIAVPSPVAAALVLALLAARALMAGDAEWRLHVWGLAGPVLGACVVYAFVGLPGAIGLLFVWRLQRDVQWSLGEAARLARACGRPAQARAASLAHGWTTPLYALALVAFSAPHVIAGLPLDLPHVAAWAPISAGLFALIAVGDWLLRRAADWRLGEVAAAPTIHMLTHHALFVLAFGAMFDLSAGVVALIAWRLAHAAPLPSLHAGRGAPA